MSNCKQIINLFYVNLNIYNTTLSTKHQLFSLHSCELKALQTKFNYLQNNFIDKYFGI